MRQGSACRGLLRFFANAYLGLIAFVPELHAQAVCAEVKIEIRQRITLERQAFDATLRVKNGLTTPVENLQVQVSIQTESGGVVGPDFFVRFDRVEGTAQGADTGPWTVPGTAPGGAQSEGSLHWMIIPGTQAGGQFPEGLRYQVGARITYTMAGEEKEINVAPEVITVLPQPVLALDYFLPAEVYGDDPFTAEVEPSVPFTLGIRVKNIGYGSARSLTIDTMQPDIRENPLGLLIGFEIVDAAIDDQPADPNLLMQFGMVEAGAIRVGRWSMLTTLSGQFFDFTADYSHADSLGGAITSLISGQPATHMLVKDVLVTGQADETLDFLAHDGDILRVYQSSGVDVEVIDVSEDATVGGSGGSYTLNLPSPAPNTYRYLKIPNPFPSNDVTFSLTSGSEAVPASNSWLSKTRKENGIGWDHFFNLFESEPASSYAIQLGAQPIAAELEGLIFIDVDDDGLRDPGEAVVANTVVRLTGITASSLSIDRNTPTNNAGRFRFADLEEGNFTLEVADIPDHINGQHSPGSAGGVVSGASITGIELDDDQIGSGYTFAKRFDPQATVEEADLALQVVAAPSEPVDPGETFQLIIGLSNAGPTNASAVGVDFNVPPGMEIVSASATAGVFDAHHRSWQLGSLGVQQAETLTLAMRSGSAGSYVVTALASHIGTGFLDPDTDDNHAAVPVELETPDELQLSVEKLRLKNVLVMSGCPTEFCLDPIIHWQDLLESSGVDRFYVTGYPDEFLLELRKGWASTIVVSVPHLNSFVEALIPEIEMSIRQGDSLIVDGGAVIDLIAGQGISGGSPLENGTPIDVVLGSPLPQITTTVDDAAWCITPGDAGTIGSYDGESCAAIVESPFGQGKTVALGFNITMIVSPVDRLSVFESLLEYVSTPPKSINSPLELVDIRATVSDGDGNDSFSLSMTADTDTLASSSAPVADESGFSELIWNRSFIANESLEYVGTFQLGEGLPSGIEQVQVELSASDDRLRVSALEFEVSSVNGFLDLAKQRLLTLALTGGDPDIRSALIAALARAEDHFEEAEHEEAIRILADQHAFSFANYADDSHTAFVRGQIAEAYKAVGRDQAPLIPVCDSSHVVSLVNSASFVASPSDNAGMEFRAGGAGHWAAAVGTAIGMPEGYDSITNIPWLAIRFNRLSWTLEFDGADSVLTLLNYCHSGSGICSGSSTVLDHSSLDWNSRSALLVELISGAVALGQTIKLTVDTINGTVFDVPDLLVGNGVAERSRVVISRGGSQTSVVLAGTVELKSSSTLPAADALRARIVPGSLRCRQP